MFWSLLKILRSSTIEGTSIPPGLKPIDSVGFIQGVKTPCSLRFEFFRKL